jgi:predicted nucleic acid-binding protein
MSVAIALLDACVLYPAPIRDLLMRLAVTGIFGPRWSSMIHDEWIRSVLESRPDLSLSQLTRTRALMDQHVNDALVEGFESLIPTLSLPDPDDRHVLAAAIAGGCDALVTFNLKDFPQEILSSHRIEVVHPDIFMLRCMEVDADAVRRAFLRQHAGLRHPPLTIEELLDTLARIGLPSTADALRSILWR